MPKEKFKYSPTDQALNIRDVCELTTISPAAWYRLIKNDKAPAPIKLGRKSIWMRSSVLAYLKRKESDIASNVTSRG